MPLVMVQGPALPVEKKRELVAGITDVMAEVYQLAPQIITVLIHENPPENVGVGGRLLIDRWAEAEKSER